MRLSLRVFKANLGLTWKSNTIAALSAAVLTTVFGAFTIHAGAHIRDYLALGVLHFILAYLFLDFLWLPLTWFHRRCLARWSSLVLALGLSLGLALWLCVIFPYDLLQLVFGRTLARQWRLEAAVFLMHGVCAYIFIYSLRYLHLAPLRPAQRTAGKILRAHAMVEAPFRPRLLLGALGFILGLYFVLIFAWWQVNLQSTWTGARGATPQGFSRPLVELVRFEQANFLNLPTLFQPYKKLLRSTADELQEEPEREQLEGESIALPKNLSGLLPAISLTLTGALLLFAGGVVPLRLMSLVLPSVQHDEAVYCQRLRHTPTYAQQFYRAILAENPLFSITSLVMLIFLIAMPLVIALSGNTSLFAGMIGTDQILFIFTLLAAWLSPIVYAGVYVDHTFGNYFNTKLSNLILGMRSHVVVFGFGDLGQRVVNRELMKLHRPGLRRKRFAWWRDLGPWRVRGERARSSHRPRLVGQERIISPELNLELLCTHFIIVDRNSDNFFFAATNDSLGVYGVVSVALSANNAPESALPAYRRRVLVPIVQGDATEPFTLSRVNLERASFLISMVSQEERIRDIFTRATEVGLRAIICVSRSDQMVNLTYKATAHPITLVYPKQNSGLALGQRLLAATLKVRPQLPEGQNAPRIMILGLNKSNHYMLETLWHNWPVDNAASKARIFNSMLRFIITGEEYDHARPGPESTPQVTEAAASGADAASRLDLLPVHTHSNFDRIWRASYITGFRYFQSAIDERPLCLAVPTAVMRTDEARTLELCLHEFRPDILVINDDSANRSAMLLVRLINCLERLKFEHARFKLPLILMSAAPNDEAESKDIGDAFRLYRSLTQLYEQPAGQAHPRFAYYRRQPPRRLVGDSVHDALADTEEIISGVRENWEAGEEIGSANRQRESFELNSCLPNTAGALGRLTARLAGLEFSCMGKGLLQKFFVHASSSHAGAETSVLRPAFQYLRHLTLEVAERGFCLSGYADLQEDSLSTVMDENQQEGEGMAMRAYAKNHQRAEAGADAASTVPRLIALVTGRENHALDAQTFVEVMHGGSQSEASGKTYCPGMSICSIASYQHYMVASNGKEMEAWQARKGSLPLRDAPSYGCAKISLPERFAKTTDNVFPRYARIFCCCHAKRNDPGLLAVVLNLLNFRRFSGLHRRAERERNPEADWVANLEHFKTVSCQNRLFTLNRLFGVRNYTQDLLRENKWTMATYEKRMRSILPLALVQIMPTGSPQDARRWFDYAVALYRLLWTLAPRRYAFAWWDAHERRRCTHRLDPQNATDYPIAIQIHNRQHRKKRLLREAGCCDFCGIEDPEMACGCAGQRPWLENDR